MVTNDEKQKILDDMEEAWREILYGVRTLADVYKCDYNTLFNAVTAAINKVIDIDKLTEE